MSNRVEYQCQDGVANIVMDDGKANVMSIPMLEALHDAFDRATRDRAIVVLRSGRPGVFSAGFDLRVILAANDVAGSVAMLKSGAELALKFLAFDTPVVSVCAGHAYPMGAFLLLSSDLASRRRRGVPDRAQRSHGRDRGTGLRARTGSQSPASCMAEPDGNDR